MNSQRSLEGSSPWDYKESDTTEYTHTHTHKHTHTHPTFMNETPQLVGVAFISN